MSIKKIFSENNLKILAIAPTFYPMMGGAEKSFYELYTRLSKLGFGIDLVTPNLGDKAHEKLNGFNVIRVGKKTNGRAKKFILYQIYGYLKIKELIKKKNYDLIHVSYGLPSCFVAHWLKRKLKIPLVISEHHFGTGGVTSAKENPFIANLLLKWIYRKATKVVSTGMAQKKFVEDISGRKDVKIINNGVNLKLFHPSHYNKKLKKRYGPGKLIITVCRLDKRKNIVDLIKAAEIVIKKYPKTKFLIIGKGEERENLQMLIKRAGLEKNIILMGYVSEEDILKYYATADIFALTSKYEGFGIVYAEAMASGTPVVCYDMIASREVVADGVVGFITPQDYKAFANALIKLVENNALLKRFSKKTRKYVESKFSWQKNAEEYAQEFGRLVKG